MFKVRVNNTESPVLITAGQTVEVRISGAPIPGPRGLTWRGVYNAETAYNANDAVSFNGGSYIAQSQTTGNVPTNAAYWDVLALPGADGEGTISSGSKKGYLAGQSLSAGRLVSISGNLAYNFTPEGFSEPAGITENAATEGDEAMVVMNGEITIPGWGLTPGALYYAGPNGTLLSNPESATIRIQQIGVAINANTMIINIQQPIIL